MTARLPDPLPDGLRELGGHDPGRTWLARLPTLLEEVTENWQLRVGDAFPDASASLTVRAFTADGEPVVLKLQYPHREADHEAAALARWDGNGAVRLLAHDPDRHALLLEPCEPGAPLFELEQDAALDVLVDLLPRLWQPSGRPFTSLADEAAHWAVTLPGVWASAGRPFERHLLDAALKTIGELSTSQGEQVLLHQDLHTGNVLSAAREPWLAIDPKPLLGEPELALA